MACIVGRSGASISVESVRSHLGDRGFARWQLPDRIELVEAIPKTAVGKFDKKALRVMFPQ